MKDKPFELTPLGCVGCSLYLLQAMGFVERGAKLLLRCSNCGTCQVIPMAVTVNSKAEKVKGAPNYTG